MKKIFFSITVLLALGTIETFAQQHYGYIAWNYNIPLSNTEFLNSASASGGKAGYRFFIGEGKFSVGLDFNWTTFDQYEPTETILQPNGAITTDYFKYVYNFGLVASGQDNFPLGEKEMFIPDAGLGLGVNHNSYTLYYNIYEDVDKVAGFLIRPEAGILARFGPRKSIGVIAGIHYDFSTNKSDDFGYDNFSILGFQLGFVFSGR